nr:MAG TPA: hypothetical protein [Bacteriophage sp.]
MRGMLENNRRQAYPLHILRNPTPIRSAMVRKPPARPRMAHKPHGQDRQRRRRRT